MTNEEIKAYKGNPAGTIFGLMEHIRPKKCKMVDGRLQGGFSDHDSDTGKAIDKAIEALEKCHMQCSLVEQYKWERDIALEQLKEIGCGFGQNMEDVKKALEKADKYRWHDLRKNPDDLPEAIGGGYESEYVLVMIGTPEWYSCDWAYYHHDKKEWSTYEQNVFAWRYIEPFEEEE